MAPKVLVVGAVRGYLRRAFDKIAKFHAKNNFSFAIVVGDLFGDGKDETEDLQEMLKGNLAPPLPIYFGIGDFSLPAEVVSKLEAGESNEVVSNLVFLGRKGTIKTSDGIRIVALGGKLVTDDSSVIIGKYDPLYRAADARGLYGAHEADILVTNQWPSRVITGSHHQLPEILRSDEGTQVVSDLCSMLKPRYHFSSSPGASWEREPFLHPVGDASLRFERLTRFRGLAGIANPVKEWISAFNLDPLVPPPPAADATPSPFSSSFSSNPRKRRIMEDGQEAPFSRYRNGEDHNYSTRHGKRQRGFKQDRSDDCFLCVNRNEFRTHMLVSIGNESLVTVPKGPLPLPSTFPELSSSGHALIIPIHHAGDDAVKSSRSSQELDTEFAEMTKYRKALCKLVQSKGQGRLGAVCWEANRTGIRHCHWQFVPAPSDLIVKGLVEAGFRAYREKNEYPAFQVYSPDSRLEQDADYFRLWIWKPHVKGSNPVDAANQVNGDEGDEGSEKSIYFHLPIDQKFNIWFGREVMARLLGLEDRVNWKDTEQTEEVEEQEAKGLRADFLEFDFAMVAGEDA